MGIVLLRRCVCPTPDCVPGQLRRSIADGLRGWLSPVPGCPSRRSMSQVWSDQTLVACGAVFVVLLYRWCEGDELLCFRPSCWSFPCFHFAAHRASHGKNSIVLWSRGSHLCTGTRSLRIYTVGQRTSPQCVWTRSRVASLHARWLFSSPTSRKSDRATENDPRLQSTI